ncbi:MAG: acetyltransferase [Anaerolineae bacterium]|nr:acetyltransferase [Anaerolineae bacterium]
MAEGILIIGAGGHGKVIAEALRRQGQVVLGFLDDAPQLSRQQVLGLPVLGACQHWPTLAPEGLVIAIGSNTIRQRLAQQLAAHPQVPPWTRVVHPAATLAEAVQVGPGSVCLAGSIVGVDVVLGAHVILNTGATIDHDCTIGDFAHLAPGVHLAGGVTVGSGALIGIGACVLPGCHIGEQATIGAGAVVTGDIPPGVVAKGIPARW